MLGFAITSTPEQHGVVVPSASSTPSLAPKNPYNQPAPVRINPASTNIRTDSMALIRLVSLGQLPPVLVIRIIAPMLGSDAIALCQTNKDFRDSLTSFICCYGTRKLNSLGIVEQIFIDGVKTGRYPKEAAKEISQAIHLSRYVATLKYDDYADFTEESEKVKDMLEPTLLSTEKYSLKIRKAIRDDLVNFVRTAGVDLMPNLISTFLFRSCHGSEIMDELGPCELPEISEPFLINAVSGGRYPVEVAQIISEVIDDCRTFIADPRHKIDTPNDEFVRTKLRSIFLSGKYSPEIRNAVRDDLVDFIRAKRNIWSPNLIWDFFLNNANKLGMSNASVWDLLIK
jgi:hypothetical protein